ncbi:MAG: DJ-1/PfpI family protein [Selenomonadaceae bacterium]|nr:DJ-1/PfpI family protein [Selenomonadaceae bacterium]
MAKVLIAATEYGSWGEELQAPWDIIKAAGHEVTLITRTGKKPYPLQISVDPEFFDPVQKVHTNPKEVCDRIKELVDGEELNHPKKFKDVNMKDYDAIVITGGLGAMFDMCNDYYLHKLVMDGYKSKKVVAALCYATATLIFCRDPENGYKSIVWGHEMTAHPRAWDFYGDYDSSYELYGTDWKPNVITPGFLWPVEDLTIDAVGPNGKCVAIPTTSRENPKVVYDGTFITGTSVESSIAYGEMVVKVLKEKGL